ncbi:MAG: hypothetical protein ABSF29_12810 [Tepidisphaeraceae bacterium]|jgi:hypothetical protein
MTIISVFSVRDSTITTGDNRKTGLTPTFVFLKLLSNGSNVSAPTISEIAYGQYQFSYDAQANGEVSGQIDAGVTLSNPSDRYIDVEMVLDSSKIVQALPNAAPAASGGLPTVNGSNQVLALDGSGNALATAANLATASTNISAVETQTNKIGTNAADSPNAATAQSTIASNLTVATSTLATAANLATASTNISAVETQTNKIGTNAADSPDAITAQNTIASNLTVATSTLATAANLSTVNSNVNAVGSALASGLTVVEGQTSKIGTNAADSPNAATAQGTIASNLTVATSALATAANLATANSGLAAILAATPTPLAVQGTPTTTSIQGPNTLSDEDNFFTTTGNKVFLFFTSGALAGVSGIAIAYTGSNQTFSISPALPAAPAAGDKFVIIGSHS